MFHISYMMKKMMIMVSSLQPHYHSLYLINLTSDRIVQTNDMRRGEEHNIITWLLRNCSSSANTCKSCAPGAEERSSHSFSSHFFCGFTRLNRCRKIDWISTTKAVDLTRFPLTLFSSPNHPQISSTVRSDGWLVGCGLKALLCKRTGSENAKAHTPHASYLQLLAGLVPPVCLQPMRGREERLLERLFVN